MKQFLVLILSIVILVGCSSIEASQLDNKEIDTLESELTVLHAVRDDLKAKIEAQEKYIRELETQIGQVDAELITSHEVDEPWNYYISSACIGENIITYKIIEKSPVGKANPQVLNIIGENSFNDQYLESDRPMKSIDVKSKSDFEVLKVVISGEVKDFRLADIITYDDNFNVTDYEVTQDLGDISDTEVNIYTVIPECSPSEVLLWKDSQGNEYKHVFSYDAIGYSGRITWSTPEE